MRYRSPTDVSARKGVVLLAVLVVVVLLSLAAYYFSELATAEYRAAETAARAAQSDYYSALSPSYLAKNGPLDTLEELLLVRGVTAQLLLGNDRNRNGQFDPDENDGSGALNPGWASYLTVYSREWNLDSTG